MDQKKIGAFIASLRRERGITQEALGEALGVSQRSVSRWETGKNMPDISLLSPLAEALGVSVTELLRGEKQSEETLSRQEASEAMRALIALAEDGRRLRRVICAVLAAVVTLACMLALYNYEFSVSPSSADTLEAAIADYCFQGDVDPRVLSWTSVGGRMLALYEQKGHETAGGLAVLERGVFGKYRIVSADNFNVPVTLDRFTLQRREYVALCSVGNVEGASSVEFCSLAPDVYGDYRPERTLYTQALDGRPFLVVLPLEDGVVVSPFDSFRYRDAEGTEVPKDEISRLNLRDQEAARSGYSSAELGMIYVFEGILLLLGLVFVRYFLTDKRS